MKTTFSSIIKDEYELHCGRVTPSRKRIKEDNVYTVILKKDCIETFKYISDYNEAVNKINNHLKL